ncbi:MAG: YihY/virulence factor BrkB family protein [Xanthomonadaceae bacterium]|jgi:membrane protein|nr:YihY/virulence factor BrkB family protein [Xanthomonadaceae bacterium]
MPILAPDRIRPTIVRLRQSLPVTLAQRFMETDLMTQAASLAFFALLSMAPLSLLLLWLTASLYPSAQETLLLQIQTLAGDGARTIAETVLRNASSQPSVGSLAGAWSTLLLFSSATAVFTRLQTVLNLIFRSGAEKLDGGPWTWLKKRIFSFSVVFVLGFLLAVSMTLTTVLQIAFATSPSILPVLSTLTTLILYVVSFAFLYHYLPDRRVHWRQACLGGAITAVLFLLGHYLIGLYLRHTVPGSAYGSMGALVVMLVWVYYAAIVFFIGALLTAVIDERQNTEKYPLAAT